MNQAPMAANPKVATSDAPEAMFVLRHYRWLIIAGTILGTLIALGSCYLLRRYSPKYQASVSFQVLPVPESIAAKDHIEQTNSAEEITRFIRRQVLVIQSDDVLDQALLSDAFQTDYANKLSGQKSHWLSENTKLPKNALRTEIDVNPIPNSDVFKVLMTTRDNTEAANIVNAVCDSYMDTLRAMEKRLEDEHLRDLRKALGSMEDTVKTLESELADYRKSHNIGVVIERHSLETQMLGQLNTELIRADMDATAASSNLESIKKQVKDNTLSLSPEREQIIENDPAVRTLDNQRLGLIQDREVSLKMYGPQAKTIQAIDFRIEVVGRQLAEKREELRATARVHTQEEAETSYNMIAARAQDLRTRRAEKEQQVKDLDNLMITYNQMSEKLKTQTDILARIREQTAIESLKSLSDVSRVRRLGGAALPPDLSEIASPLYRGYVFLGFLVGLLASFGLGYLLELTNTRVRTPRDITRNMQLPLLGFVPDQQDDANLVGDISTAIRSSPTSMIAESFRQIRGRLTAQADGQPINTLLVASISPTGGASTVASNLANSMALNDLRVLLVDVNFYRPSLKLMYKNVPATGISDALSNPAVLDGAIVPSIDLPRLHLLGAGTHTSSAAELLEGKAFRDVLNQLKARYDLIIFDGAPLSLVADSISLAAKVDGVVAVVRAGVVSRGTVTRVRDQLKQVRANLLGVVLNAAQTHGAGYFKQTYRTFYEYAGQGTAPGSR